MSPGAAAEDTPTQHAATATIATSTPVSRTAPAREKPSSSPTKSASPSTCSKRPETGFEPVSAERRVPGMYRMPRCDPLSRLRIDVNRHAGVLALHRKRLRRRPSRACLLRTTSERLADLQPGSCLAVEAGAAAGLTRRACGSQPPDYAGPYASRATGHQNMPLCSRIVVITTTNALGRTALKPLRAPGGSAGLGSGRVRRGSEGGDRRAGRDEAARQRRGQEGPDQGFGGV